MALAAATNWEVRTTGAATNGGGYSSGGTDYSQQDAAQLSLTDLANLSTSTTLTSATGGFTAAMIGNIIYIASGTNFIAGYYQITAYTDTNTVTIDRTANATLNATAGVGKVGGATNHPNTISAIVVAGNTIYIQNGTYLKVGANAYVLTTTVAGAAGTPIRWVGYITNHSTIPTGTNRPVLSGGNNTTNVVTVAAAAVANTFENLIFYDATGDGILQTAAASGCMLKNCRSYSHGGDGAAIEMDILIFDCEFDTNSANGIDDISAGRGAFVGCYAHDNTGDGFGFASTSNSMVLSCIFDSNTGDGFANTGAGSDFQLMSCLAYNNTAATSDGFIFDNASYLYPETIIINNSAINNGQYGFISDNAVTAYNYLFDFNNYNGNGTAGLNKITAGVNDNTTAPSFTDAPNGNFRLASNDTALLNKGYPGTTLGGGSATV